MEPGSENKIVEGHQGPDSRELLAESDAEQTLLIQAKADVLWTRMFLSPCDGGSVGDRLKAIKAQIAADRRIFGE